LSINWRVRAAPEKGKGEEGGKWKAGEKRRKSKVWGMEGEEKGW